MSTLYSPRIVTDGMILCYDPANPKSYVSGSNKIFNLSSAEQTASLVNGPTYSSIGCGTILFDGSNDYGISNSILSGSTTATMCMWTKRNSTGTISVIGCGIDSTSTPRIELIWFTNGFFYGEVGANQDVWVNAAVPTNDTNWHHVCMTYDGSISANLSKIKLYFDGRAVTVTGQSGTIATTIPATNNFFINTRGGGYSSGYMGAIHVYNRALSAEEILRNYNALRGRYSL